MKLWGGRFNKGSSSLLEQFNASIGFDNRMYAEDIAGSIAHSKMLNKIGILTVEEQQKIENGLIQIKDLIDNGNFEFHISDEDIHMAVEKKLIELIGSLGGKLHTGRSRNDQVALDIRMYLKKEILNIKDLLKVLMEAITQVAESNKDVIMPGYTHLQRAQPILFSHHMMAYYEMMKRDLDRLEDCFKRVDVMPLGAGALAGTTYPLDRHYVAELLGFSKVTENSLDTVSDRDFIIETNFVISMILMHLSRFSEELIIWSTSEFSFVEMDDTYSTGSSIMPQKKNPDVPELLRGKTGRVNGNLISLLTVLKGLPLAYNKDMQEDKEGVFDSVETVYMSLNILKEAVRTMTINVDRMKQACEVGHLSATDLADYLVQKCDIPFREAHFITGRAVAHAESLGIDLSVMSVAELQKVDPRIGNDVCEYLSLVNSMNARTSQGGTAVSSTCKQIEIFETWMKARR